MARHSAHQIHQPSIHRLTQFWPRFEDGPQLPPVAHLGRHEQREEQQDRGPAVVGNRVSPPDQQGCSLRSKAHVAQVHERRLGKPRLDAPVAAVVRHGRRCGRAAGGQQQAQGLVDGTARHVTTWYGRPRHACCSQAAGVQQQAQGSCSVCHKREEEVSKPSRPTHSTE